MAVKKNIRWPDLIGTVPLATPLALSKIIKGFRFDFYKYIPVSSIISLAPPSSKDSRGSRCPPGITQALGNIIFDCLLVSNILLSDEITITQTAGLS